MKKIIVAFWHSPIPEAGFTHQEEFEYSNEKRNSIIDSMMEKGISVMIRPMTIATGWKEEGVIMWLDKGRFGQR